MSFVDTLMSKLNGWKSIIGYALLQIPLFNANPMLLGAAQAFLSAPSQATALPLIGQLVLAFGISHKILKSMGVTN